MSVTRVTPQVTLQVIDVTNVTCVTPFTARGRVHHAQLVTLFHSYVLVCVYITSNTRYISNINDLNRDNGVTKIRFGVTNLFFWLVSLYPVVYS